MNLSLGPIHADVVSSKTVLLPKDGGATAEGGVGKLGVDFIPALNTAVTQPLENALADVQPITVPLGLTTVTVDIRQALRELGPVLSRTQLVTADLINAQAAVTCTPEGAKFSSSSNVVGLRVGGNIVSNQDGITNVGVLDSANIDPSDIDISKVQIITAGVSIGDPNVLALLQAALKPILDTLPTISVPAQLAQVKVSTGTKTQTADTLIQDALRVQVSLLGRSIVDTTIGQAGVRASDVACPQKTGPTGDPNLVCTGRYLALLDVYARRKQNDVYLRGVARAELIGQRVRIRFTGSGNIQGHATVRQDGSFGTTVHMPVRSIRSTNRARYTAEAYQQLEGGGRKLRKSLELKLERRLRIRSVSRDGEMVRFTGRVTKPFTVKREKIHIMRQVGCGRRVVVKSFYPNRDGTFVVHVKSSANLKNPIYRMKTKVREKLSNPRIYPTFTLPTRVK